jgi:hypothetical protein
MNTLNIIGYSSGFSKVLDVLFAAVPGTPPTPAYVSRHGGDLDSGLQPYITVAWEGPTELGGLPILGYLVQT